ncbi:MAG TPA: hypothetical protein VF058_05370 [Actinomycetota bacterium]
MGSVMGADRFYDAGEIGCGGPTLKEIGRLVDGLPAGGNVEVRSTTHTGRNSLRAFCRLRELAIEAEDAGPNRDRILIRKT